MALAGCGADTHEIRVGFIGPLTGDAVSYGNDVLHATELAVNEWNARGGIRGKQIRLFVEDGRCKGSDATEAAKKLIHVNTVAAILGGNCSSETLAAAFVAEQENVVLFATASSSKDITQAGDFVFRMWPSNEKAARIVYRKYFEDRLETKLAIISEQTDYCRSLHDAVLATLPAGTDVVFDEQVNAGEKDFRTLFTRLKLLDVDVVFVNMQGDGAIAAAVSQLRELGINAQILTNEIGESNKLNALVGDALDGTVLVSAAFPDDSREPGKSFPAKFVKNFGEPNQSIVFPALAYDAANILFSALEMAGTDGKALRDYLYDLSGYPGTVGTVSFDRNGDVEGIPYSIKQWQNGHIVEQRIIPLE